MVNIILKFSILHFILCGLRRDTSYTDFINNRFIDMITISIFPSYILINASYLMRQASMTVFKLDLNILSMTTHPSSCFSLSMGFLSGSILILSRILSNRG